MIVTNLLVGLPAMLLCLVVQVAFAFWSVRYYVRQSATATNRRGLLAGIRPLLVAMLVMMLGTLVQIALWGALFVVLGGVQRALRGHLPLGSEFCVAGLR